MNKKLRKEMKNNFSTPILFLIFNRPNTTKRVFAEIRKAKPNYLFIASDGPRESKEGEKKIVEKTRKMVLDGVDWNCEVKTLFRDKNLGCKYAVSGSIDWFFEQVEEGIILEDDCLPNQSFFRFCEELLKKYRNDEKISMISGDNFQFGWKNNANSYYFSKYCHIWGWATWRRAWKNYDVKIKTFPEFLKSKKIESIFDKKEVQKYWLGILNNAYKGKIDTWDYQWVYSVWMQDGLCILPNVNLVSNIGCENGTHMQQGSKKSKVSEMVVENMEFPLTHPKEIKQNIEAEEKFFDDIIRTSLAKKIIQNIILWIKK